jgi:hypothetical protein
MRLQLMAARGALTSLVLAVLAGIGAVACVRLGIFTDTGGRTVMILATALGLLALGLALVWLKQALTRNAGDGKRLGLIALAGSLIFLYHPLSYVYYGFTALPIHDATTDPEDPPQFVALAKIQPANGRVFDSQRKITYKARPRVVRTHSCNIPKGEPDHTGKPCPKPEKTDEESTSSGGSEAATTGPGDPATSP